jgi:hypothetical protein
LHAGGWRQLSWPAPIIAIFASASASEQEQAVSVAAGANVLLAKPSDPDRLLMKVGVLVRLTWMHEQIEGGEGPLAVAPRAALPWPATCGTSCAGARIWRPLTHRYFSLWVFQLQVSGWEAGLFIRSQCDTSFIEGESQAGRDELRMVEVYIWGRNTQHCTIAPDGASAGPPLRS